ncbi:MAG: hypothetical protein OK441_02405, partial [Thaumarchaeota archaeon]|nr:hypothetical protein [Nitrososphaerota archaeon]
MKRSILIGTVSAVVIVGLIASMMVIGGISGSGIAGIPGTGGGPKTINKDQSGLIASDPLNNFETQQQLQANDSFWQYGGSGSSGGYYNFFEAADQLHIGVAANGSGGWTGFYGVTPPTNASLVHAVLSANATTADGYADTGLYMSASNQLLNYIACLAVTTPTGTVWGVVHAQSATGLNPTITPIWVDFSQNQPLTRDCVMVTNGENSLSVYLDHVLVYQANDISLNMPPPYSFYVEQETQVASGLLYGNYQDFYATLGDAVSVTGLPSTAQSVDLVGVSGTVYASAQASSGRASL